MMVSPARYLDSHCHLQEKGLSQVTDGIMERARNVGITRMLCNATCEADWQAVVDLAASRQEVIPFLGIHPWFAENAGTGWEKRLQGLLAQIPAGIGETGLDRCCRADFSRQQHIFETQLQMASELKRPLVIHCVKAWGKLLEILEGYASPLPPMMIHSFAGSRETLQRLLRIGCFISFSGRLAADSKLHPCFLATPLANLLLETDSQGRPGVARAMNGKRATDASGQLPDPQTLFSDEPAAISHLYQLAARMRGMVLEEFCQEIWRNGEIFTDTILPR
ncbi:MAG: TatD family hydrolase [Proteobacteria bacterium]|nr:TatD family hydrolase [Pseudomonadota bacterium]MBU1648516.1 TatD family hydrolase [Pseudomonadota bacterium]MBU1986817.1 TatD family hydrolase [Pseudomonadota bacterium]